MAQSRKLVKEIKKQHGRIARLNRDAERREVRLAKSYGGKRKPR